MSKSVTGNVQKKQTKAGVRYYPYVNIKIDGKNKPEYLGCSFTTKKEALRRLNDEIALRNRQRESDVRSGNMLFADWVAVWLAEKEAQNKIKSTTLNNYKQNAQSHIIPYFAANGMRLADVGWYEIEKYLQEKTKTHCTSSLKCHAVVISQALRYAKKHKLILATPMQDVEMPESKKTSPTSKFVPNVEQFDQILSALEGDELYPLICFTASLGLRRSEVTALTWGVFNERERSLEIRHTIVDGEFRENITKSGSSRRSCPLDGKLYALLMRVKAEQEENKRLFGQEYHDDGYIFTRPGGERYDPNYLTATFPKLVVEAGFPRMTFHGLRKFACSALMNGGVSTAEVAKFAGHSDVTVFYNYYAFLDLGHKLELTEKITQNLGIKDSAENLGIPLGTERLALAE